MALRPIDQLLQEDLVSALLTAYFAVPCLRFDIDEELVFSTEETIPD
jgi:hypothetical protein